jgi:hypothetical protein
MHEILDLKRYPLDQLDSESGQELVKRCQDDLARDGLFNLTGLMLAQAIEAVVAQTDPLFESSSFAHRRMHNIYFLPEVQSITRCCTNLRRRIIRFARIKSLAVF